MDALDQASLLETKQRQMAMAHHRANQKKPTKQESAYLCIECDAAIPEGRRQHIVGCQYCTQCQSDLETMKR